MAKIIVEDEMDIETAQSQLASLKRMLVDWEKNKTNQKNELTKKIAALEAAISKIAL